MVFYGISMGTFYPLIAVLVRKYSGASRISGGLGWAFVFQGAAYLLGQPIAGTQWLQVFATVKGTGQKAVDAWSDGTGENVVHDKSPLVEQWGLLGIKRL
ncbi:Hypp9519 [Branchiostoma lanceolatum]|uniref:Hypp9519 protein n=1 Tax=Branchiostoma lanceolatum TaxID=7740 RepID=A0A8S4MNM6_BRALA|nr:Hypp9519 [Branchiostoma lanceolatum]